MSQRAPHRSGPIEPLGQVTSIKVKLGLLVAASVLVAVGARHARRRRRSRRAQHPGHRAARARRHPAARGRDDVAAAADDRGRAADGGGRLRRTRRDLLDRRGRRAGPGVQPDGGRPGHRRPPATRPRGERLARAAYAADRTGRRAGEPRRRGDRARPGDDPRRARPGRAAEQPGRRPARPLPGRCRRGRRWTAARCRSPPWWATPSRRHGRGCARCRSTYASSRPDLVVDADRVAAAPAAGQPARQRGPAQPGRRRGTRLGRPGRATWSGSRSPTRAPASRRRTASGSSSGSAPCRTPPAAAPVSGSRSRAG